MQLRQSVSLAIRLWLLGIYESLQLQRCVVLLALDDTGSLWRTFIKCVVLNGFIFLGSIAWWQHALEPLISFSIQMAVAPLLPPAAASVAVTALHLSYQVLWLAPAYLTTMLVSCAMYNEMAATAVQVHPRHAAKLLSQQRSSTTTVAPSTAGTQKASSPKALSLEVAAQEVYRVVLFLVLYLEVWLIGQLPYVGRGLSIMASCWMTSFFCFDYRWALQGTPLLDRLAFFECAAPFFGGFGLLLAVVTAVMPFYSGAAVIAILFPLFVLVACG
ncbi:hypothetical protein QJQ45_022464 [Haematococcus lacustris]|nr:hypothetical protein QJQ45_022464 [Haematococcus lacustris]